MDTDRLRLQLADRLQCGELPQPIVAPDRRSSLQDDRAVVTADPYVIPAMGRPLIFRR